MVKTKPKPLRVVYVGQFGRHSSDSFVYETGGAMRSKKRAPVQEAASPAPLNREEEARNETEETATRKARANKKHRAEKTANKTIPLPRKTSSQRDMSPVLSTTTPAEAGMGAKRPKKHPKSKGKFKVRLVFPRNARKLGCVKTQSRSRASAREDSRDPQDQGRHAGKHASRCKMGEDVFSFPHERDLTPTKKPGVKHAVLKTISKMLQENECIRRRLITNSQLGHTDHRTVEVHDAKTVSNEGPLFGWVDGNGSSRI
ncbi:uncharacterized protein LOC136763202 isoform X2 [Amia ocellicauda]|uniref:uncharacterized protein LOC136763202 isoform X2 n=1 Tax=Amia ocellicauda TaxID=2972642 RepID=UPI003463F1F2